MEEQEQGLEGQVGLFNVEDYEVPSQEEPEPEIESQDLEMLQDIALNAIGKIPLQDLINDAVSALVEVYKAKPHVLELDIENYEHYPPLLSNPFSDLVTYLREIQSNAGTLNGAE